MAKDLALGIVIGGAVSATFGKAISDTSSKIEAMKKRANDSRLWQRQIGETMRLQDEFRRLHLAGDSAADGIRRKLDSNLKSLRDAGIEVGRLDRAYAQLGRTARGLDLKVAGRERFAAGQEAGRGVIGDAVKLTAAVAVPATIAANYQAIIRDIALKAGIARTQEEAAMGARIRRDAGANGIGRNELADAVNQMVAGGMDLDRALNFAPLVAKFSIGQGATTVETAKMIQALQQNAEIVDPQQMSKALEAIAYLGKEGSFESVDMARWFPVLLAEMKKIGITGQDSVTQLGAMLQVQMKTAGSSDEAANNLKNWFSKIGSGETERNYAKAGVDYQAKMREAIGKGWSTMEASFVLARAYIERVDPAKAKQLAAAAKQFNSEMDPSKRQAQMAAFAETMKTGDLFNDMQVKAALTAYMQNAELYSNLKRNAQQASGEIQKDLEARRETSKQIWNEVGQRWDDAMRSIGDALRPITDRVGEVAKGAGSGIQSAADSAPKATAAVVGIAGTVLAVRGAKALWSIGRGMFDIARGTLLARGGRGAAGRAGGGAGGAVGRALDALGGAAGAAGGVQRVFVVNMPGGGTGGGGLGDLMGGGRAGRAARRAATMGGRLGRIGRIFNAGRALFGRVAPYAGKLAVAGTVLKFGLAAREAYAVASSTDTNTQKANRFAGIAGSLAGGVMGAKLGAMVGAIGGPIGSAVLGVIGGAVGTFAGDKLFSAISRKVLDRKSDETPANAAAVAKAAKAAESPAADARFGPRIDQTNTFAPVFNVKIEASETDMANKFLAQVSPQLTRMMEEHQRKANSRTAMFDAPHM
ncbi:phage tail tape measure protein [Burkholderia cenocepacia]|uniref:phage tail tape measure protein n=1 Tax=Burkholderia cenocepacia TaxID=95486 RepID=UPI00209D3FF8|nr:phage tail tape measure protein [Burkholderia cenocepacia]MCO8421396.1 phage tail tape measure protein [Burkholderia cenocepacia]MCO8471092.1 phage tail tape measure protein [Burkholderia cenocepacia]MCO8476422.1 phage tail tape measure protein [Burkholderia cenocepacia]MCO8486649.1 phage tail tape measure protein [Burkholderia cenocepacia]MCO8502489.1 phage tail tape measure protein [Burkholderia cenocepacia]